MPTPLIQPPQFNDPYEHTAHKVRLQTYISDVDHSFIRGIRGKSGTLTIVVNTLWHKFCTSLRDENILTSLDRDRFERFVEGMVISIPKTKKDKKL